MSNGKITAIVIGCILALFILIFAANEFQIFGTKFWGVRQENARREVFEQTQSYVQGKRQELVKLKHEWENADIDSKKTIEATIRISFANFPEGNLDQYPDLQYWFKNIMNN